MTYGVNLIILFRQKKKKSVVSNKLVHLQIIFLFTRHTLSVVMELDKLGTKLNVRVLIN